jgi:hypothetical protein
MKDMKKHEEKRGGKSVKGGFCGKFGKAGFEF